MPSPFEIKEIHVNLADGVKVVATVTSIEGIKALIGVLRSEKLVSLTPPLPERPHGTPSPPAPKPQAKDTSEAKMETRAALQAGSLAKTKLIAFKDNIPQLLRPTVLKPTDAVVILLFAVEAGLGNTKMDYQSFKDLYDAQNIKSGSPLAMKLTDLRNGGYIDKKSYSSDRSILLTAKGERKAIEVIRNFISQAG
jgi:hypothetical protein